MAKDKKPKEPPKKKAAAAGKDEPKPLTEAQLKEIAAHRAEALKRVQEMHRQNQQNRNLTDKGGEGHNQSRSKGRIFRHQGR